jgi:hypothetical protein
LLLSHGRMHRMTVVKAPGKRRMCSVRNHGKPPCLRSGLGSPEAWPRGGGGGES